MVLFIVIVGSLLEFGIMLWIFIEITIAGLAEYSSIRVVPSAPQTKIPHHLECSM